MIPAGKQSCRYIGTICRPAHFVRYYGKRASAAPGSSTFSERTAGSRSGKLVEQRLRFRQIRRVEPFGEPAVDRGEKVAGFGAAALVAAEAGEAHSGAQFPELGLLLHGDAQGCTIQFLGSPGMPLP